MKTQAIATITTLLCAFLAVGCAAEPEAHTTDDDIVGGVDANGKAVAAVNAVYSIDKDGKKGGGCTGTLIGPRVVLTAKHCVLTDDNDPASPTWLDVGGSIEFRIGTRRAAPEATYRASKVYLCGLEAGGAADLGCDVALLRLDSDVANVAPLTVSSTPLTKEQIGTRFTAVGYGTTDAANSSATAGTKKMASLTLRAIEGRPYEANYPTFESFLAALETAEGAGFADRDPNRRQFYEYLYTHRLLDSYEASVGGGADEAQDCHGDSGGPLLKNVDGKLVVYGVVSTGVSGQKQVCENMGAVYATFGPAAQTMIATALAE